MTNLLIPSYSIKVSGREVKTSTLDLESLSVDLNLDTPTDCCRLTVEALDWTPDIESGDPIQVDLGYEDALTTVFAGHVESIERSFTEVKIFALSPMIRLLNKRVNQPFLKMSIEQIVKNLAQDSGLDAETDSSGIDLDAYYVDRSRNAYEVIKELAEVCGFDVYMTPESKLVFKKYNPKEKHTFEYKKDIISIEAESAEPAIGSVTVYGESPSSQKGSDSVSWISKDDVSGSAQGENGGGGTLEMVDSSLRDQDSANKAAQARLKMLSDSRFFAFTVVGSPLVKLGDAVVLKGFKEDVFNGEFKVTHIEHHFSTEEGFTTLIECEGTGE